MRTPFAADSQRFRVLVSTRIWSKMRCTTHALLASLGHMVAIVGIDFTYPITCESRVARLLFDWIFDDVALFHGASALGDGALGEAGGEQ
jgi:hypothetical protein